MNKPDQTVSGIETAGRPALKDVFKDDFYVGAALSLDQISGKEPEAMGLVAKQFNSITPENILKWEEVHPKPGQYDFEAADRYVAFGEKHKMHIIGHTLVWHNQTPDWVFQDASGKPASRETLLERLREHISTVVGRYRGRIHGWDVVNETIMADGSWRQSKWFEILGEDHVSKAFEFARQADPDAELYYNDFDLEIPAKNQGVIGLVKNLQAKGIRVDGVGTQCHWFLDRPSLDEIEKHIVALGGLGVKVMVTELDVGVLPFYPLESNILPLSSFDAETQQKYNPYPDGLPEAVEQKFVERYAALFALFHKHRDKLGRVTFWGVHDGQSWRNYWPIIGRTDYPMLFDSRCQPKAALKAVLKVVNGRA